MPGLLRDGSLAEEDDDTAETVDLTEFDGEGEEGDVFDSDGDDADDADDDEDVQSYLLFSSENWRWPSWLPRLHLEVISRRTWEGNGGGGAPSAATLTTQEELAHLREVFPQVTEGELRRVLLATSSLEGAIEQLLNGLEE